MSEKSPIVRQGLSGSWGGTLSGIVAFKHHHNTNTCLSAQGLMCVPIRLYSINTFNMLNAEHVDNHRPTYHQTKAEKHDRLPRRCGGENDNRLDNAQHQPERHDGISCPSHKN
jgi:hypothetical protein